MDIKFESADKVSGKLTVNVTAEDYQAELEKSLKKFRTQARMNGFRPGCVPMAIVKKLYGAKAKAEEVSKAVNKGIEDYLKKNNIKVLGHILPSDEQKPQDYKTDDSFTYVMDIAIEPEINVTLSKDDKLPYYDINVSDEFVDQRVKDICNSNGKFEPTDTYEKGAYLEGNLTEVNPAEGEEPLKVEGVYISPEYVSDEDQKKLFEGSKTGDVLTLTPAKLYKDETQVTSMLKIKKEDLAKHSGEFTYTITKINHNVPAELNQELFDKVLGKDVVKDEKAFREKIRENQNAAEVENSDFKFLEDMRDYALEKAGELQFSEPLLKRLIKENNPKADDKYINDNYAEAVDQLKWQLVRDHLVEAAGIKVEQNDVKQMAYARTRSQFAAYGMSLPDELVEKYSERSLKDDKQFEELFMEVLTRKLIAAYKDIVTLDHKKVSFEEFEDMVKKAHEKK